MCAIEAASSVDDGTILFTESEFTNDCDPPDGYEVPGAPDCPVGDDGQCFEY